MNTTVEKKRYIHSLDGLRALAVISVIFYHIGFGWASGGFLGVCVFFVLSGYLITDLLVVEKEKHGRIDLKSFWYRRAKRLLPAMFTLLVAILCWVVLFDRHFLESLKGDLVAALFYFSNWWYIFHHVSYFDSFNSPSLLTHFWSLAVEEQFYLLWPILITLGLKFLSKRSVLWLTLVAAIISGLAMAFIYQPGADPSRVYYGTDTRAFSLLIGSALALCWPSQKLAAKVPFSSRIILNITGGVGLVILLWMLKSTNQYDSFLYYGGMILLSIVTAFVIAILVHPASDISKIFKVQPLRYLGVRSYGMYLWHYPVIMLTTPTVNTEGISFVRVLVQIALIIILSSLSYKYIENPIRQNGFGVWRKMFIPTNKRIRRLTALAVLAFVFISALAMNLDEPNAKANNKIIASSEQHALSQESNKTHSKQYVQKENKEQSVLTKIEKKQEEKQPNHIKEENTKTQKKTNITPHNTAKQKNEIKQSHQVTAGEKENEMKQSHQVAAGEKENLNNKQQNAGSPSTSTTSITAIGDSIMVDVEPYLKEIFPSITVNAEIGRQMYQALDVVKQMKNRGELGNYVIIEMGTNGPFTKDQLATMVNTIGSNRKIVFVNTRVPRPWQNIVNTTLQEELSKYPNTMLINWYAASANHNDYFAPDGVHLNREGSQVYASLLRNAIK